jgi:ABC-type Na+ efflux pump permease subunit
MKRFIKRFTFTLFALSLMLFLAVEYFSNRIASEFEQMQKLYSQNRHLSDATIICMQLYMLNPTELNEKTCLYLKFQITQNKKALEDLTFATFYLNYLEEN